MKLFVRVRGEWFTVPCKGGETVKWLGEEALRRYEKIRAASVPVSRNDVVFEIHDGVLAWTPGDCPSRYEKIRPASVHVSRNEVVFEIRQTRGGALLDVDDIIKTVLDDNDFVSVVLQSDISDPVMEPVEVPYVPEQVPGYYKSPTEFITMDGNTLTCDDLMRLGKGELKIKLSDESENCVIRARQMLEEILAENKVVYGVNTGFGKFARTLISKEDLEDLQTNLIRSHAAGVGQPLPPERTRRLLALRINVLAKGYSGISLKVLNQYIAAFNASCLSWVPEKGSVGASGDLAPLSHLALGLMGEGKMWSPESGWGEARYVLESHSLEPIKMGPKEGLALINGTQFISALGVEAVERAGAIARQADIVAALSLEVLKGTSKAFASAVHKVRPHTGQMAVARRLRSVLHSETYPSEIAESHRFCNRVQDAYTLRCCPQVHGIVHDTVQFVHSLLTVEINSATDNPMVFVDLGEIISGGNFHGEYPGKACDYLAIGIHEVASMSERRIERLVNPAYSELPAFLTSNGGLNSGFMIAHCTAAALVSENKVLCHPSTVDSLTTSAGTEDHVSMGAWSSRKALQVVDNVEHVIAIELLAACQAIEFLRPLKTTQPLEEVYKLVRAVVKPWDKDRYMAPDIDAVVKILREEQVWRKVKPMMDHYHSQQAVETPVRSPTTSYHSSAPACKRRKTRSDGQGKAPSDNKGK